MQGIRDQLQTNLVDALLGFDDMCTEAIRVLTDGFDTSLLVTVTSALVPFCMTIIGICLFIELAQVAMKVDMLKWEHGLKCCVKMVLARLFIDIAPTFLEACYLTASGWIAGVGAVGAGIGATVQVNLGSILTGVTDFFDIMGVFLSTFVLVLAIKACGVVIAVIAFGRMFELYVYLAVSPIPCAFFPLGDGSGGGFSRITAKFLRSFAAVCLQGVMMVVCMRVFDEVMQSIIAAEALTAAGTAAAGGSANAALAVSNLCWALLLGAIVLVMSVVKCGSWAKAILDAN